MVELSGFFVLRSAPTDSQDPRFVFHPSFSMAGIGYCVIKKRVDNQDTSREREFFQEVLYLAMLVPYLVLTGQTKDRRWINANRSRIHNQVQEIFESLGMRQK